jgi:tetratricopeptide (TPR) repeat protein
VGAGTLIPSNPSPTRPFGEGADNDPDYRAALDAARQGRFQDAIQGFRAVLTRNPKHFNALMNMGKVFTALENHAEAAVRYLGALRIDPENAYAQQGLAKSYVELGLEAQAAGLADRIAARNPSLAEGLPRLAREAAPPRSNPRAFEPLVNGLLRQGMAEEALPLIRLGTSENPDQPELLLLEGDTLTRLGQFDRAEAIIRQVLESDPQNPASLLKLGDLYAAKGQAENAVGQYQQVLKARFVDAETLFDLHDRFRALNRPEGAKQVLDRIKGTNLSEAQLARLQERLGTGQ